MGRFAAEEIVETSAMDSPLRQVVSSGGQRLITIVTDGVPLGNLPASSMGQQFIVTMPNGQQGKRQPAGDNTIHLFFHFDNVAENPVASRSTFGSLSFAFAEFIPRTY